jgi:diaminopimelate epimerase
MKTLPFVKYSGNGNDFIILEGAPALTSETIRAMCDRHFGVGADGVLYLGACAGFDAEMRIFNADGGEAEMCGNGLRCLVTYLDDKSLVKKDSYLIKTMNGSYNVTRRGGSFALEMSEVREINKYDLSSFKDFKSAFFVNTGVPHLVFLGESVRTIDFKKIAPFYRYHQMFPTGANVSLVELRSRPQSAYVRTYERGVEGETYSCGTGLTACALALSHWLGWKGDIHLETLGGQQKVTVAEKIFYSGEVKYCFAGSYPL